MKMHNKVTKSIIIILTLSTLGGQNNIPYRNSIDLPEKTGKFEQSILSPNRFQMNQSFSLSTSMNGKISQTTGVFSNFTSYKLSEQINIRTGLHLIQNQNNLAYSSGSKLGMGYELGLEYQLNPNIFFSFQVINSTNSPILYRNFSPFNVP